MENKDSNRGTGLINPERIAKPEKKQHKIISTSQDGLMERDDKKVLTEDGRELLKEN